MAKVKCVGEGWASGINRINNSDLKKKDKQIDIGTSACISTSMNSSDGSAQMAVPPPEEGAAEP